MLKLHFDGGDGDQGYLGSPFTAVRVYEPWFPDRVRRGPAWLVRIGSGAHEGEFLALTSRVVASLDEQLEIRDYLSVVVHVVKQPGPGFSETEENLPAIGMAAVEVVRG